MSKRALVCGAGGFIGSHLVRKLKQEGYWVRGVDLKAPEYSPSAADEFLLLDLREQANCERALRDGSGAIPEVYQLAADMGGMGFIHSSACEIMHNSVLVNVHMTATAAQMGVQRYFFSSSVCIYRDMQPGEPEMHEDQAIPANPDNDYGWEKLYSERMAQAYGKRYGMTVRIARAVGRVAERRHRPPFAARWRRPPMAEPSKSGATARPCDPISTWMT